MMMNMSVDFLKAGYDFCVRKYGTSTQSHLDAMDTLSKMYEHAYDEYKSIISGDLLYNKPLSAL